MTEIPETASRARQRYAAGDPVKAILADTGFSHFRFYFWLDGAPQPDTTTLLPPIPRQRIIVHEPDPAEARAALVARMMRATEMQLHEIEQHLTTTGYESGDSERNARVRGARPYVARIDRARCLGGQPQAVE
jgi:hypothetical protein